MESPSILSDEVIRRIVEAVQAVAASTGWGAVTIVIEKGRATKLQRHESAWLDRDEPPRAQLQTP